jgi:transcriptional regulator NrdR family protein
MNGTANTSTPENRGCFSCPKCGHRRFRVVYTRTKGSRIVRRRACLRCAARITTWEHIISL